MTRILFLILLILHAFIHIPGFLKNNKSSFVSKFSYNVKKINGFFWLITFILFIVTAFLFFIKSEWWWLISFDAILISVYLIILNWKNAKYGIITNVIILIPTIIAFASWNFQKQYKDEVITSLNDIVSKNTTLLTEADIQSLPEPVRKYIDYTGSLQKPKVNNFFAAFSAQLRKSNNNPWMNLTSHQYNFINSSNRYFFLDAIMKGLPVAGFHSFKNGIAYMDIRLMSIFKVQYETGNVMDTSETVTFFNDMCVLAPATLIDKRITWTDLGNNIVKAEFINNGIKINALLYFNDEGQLINFESENRYAMTDDGTLKKYKWSTPLSDYKLINGYKLATTAKVIYAFPKEDFTYGKFTLTDIRYNCTVFK